MPKKTKGKKASAAKVDKVITILFYDRPVRMVRYGDAWVCTALDVGAALDYGNQGQRFTRHIIDNCRGMIESGDVILYPWLSVPDDLIGSRGLLLSKKAVSNLCKDSSKPLASELRVLLVDEIFPRLEKGRKINTPKPKEFPAHNFRDRIIQLSYERYYRPAHEVRRAIQRRHDRWQTPFKPSLSEPVDCVGMADLEELIYDTF